MDLFRYCSHKHHIVDNTNQITILLHAALPSASSNRKKISKSKCMYAPPLILISSTILNIININLNYFLLRLTKTGNNIHFFSHCNALNSEPFNLQREQQQQQQPPFSKKNKQLQTNK